MKVQPITVILVSGKMGSGKNHISEQILLPMLPPEPTLFLSFANHFKIDAIVKDGLDREKVFGDKDDVTRVALQRRGTEEGRDVYGADIWVDLALEWMFMSMTQGYTRFVYTDGRFANEVEKLAALDGTQMTVQGQVYEFRCVSLRVVAPGRSLARATKEAAKNNVPVEKITGHLSETALDDYQGFTYVVANDYEDDVYPVMKNIARELTDRFSPAVRYIVDVDDTLCICGQYYEDVIKKAEGILADLAVEKAVDADQNPDPFIEEVREYYAKKREEIYAAAHTGIFRRETFAKDMQAAFVLTATHFGFDGAAWYTKAQEIYESGMGVFDQPYTPFPGALESLTQLQELGPVVLYTHGDRIEQMTKIARLGLSRLPVLVSPNKGDDSLALLMANYPAREYVMIGDNFKRDAMPAVRAKCARVYWINQQVFGHQDYSDSAKAQGVVEVTSIVSALVMEQTIHTRAEIVKKWAQYNLLDGMEGPLRENVATLLENQANFNLSEAPIANEATAFEDIKFPIIRRVFPGVVKNPATE